jgi:ubiquinone biosynthesis UbiH/UbiF/VisC/COQ6 family hydroxylase
MNAGRIVVAGAGPVGLAFACACRDLDVSVVEANARPPEATPELDVRIFALSTGTRAFLRSIAAWDRLDQARVTPVRRMEVFGDSGARLAFAGRPGAALAWIVEAGRLSSALGQQAASLGTVTLRRGVQVDRFEAAADGVRIGLQDGAELEADLLVGADGPDSRVRAALGLPVAQRAYGETAIVANFDAEKDHGHVARQWFRPDGVLAWLPLPGRRISIVWSAPDGVAKEIAELAPDQIAARVRDAGAAALGDLRLASRLATFALRLIRVDRTVAPGVALVGDAAHGVHPLAGQGVNLGFQDSRVLADELARRSPLERPGDLRLLRRYARARREDVTAMQFVTDGLDRLFASDAPGASWLRNAGMGLVEAQPWIKGALAERAMR